MPTGQGSVQMFNYGTYLNNGGNTGAANPITGVSDGLPDVDQRRPAGSSASRACSRSCRARASRASSSSATPASRPAPTSRACMAYRALLDKYGLHAGGWHGDMSEAGWAGARERGQDPRRRLHRLRRRRRPRHRQLRATRCAPPRRSTGSASTPSRPASARSTSTTTPASSTPSTSTTACSSPRWHILMERTDPRYVFAEVDVFWSSDAFHDVTGDADRGADQQVARRACRCCTSRTASTSQRDPANSRSGTPRAVRHRRGRLPADLRRRRRTACSTTTRSTTAARSTDADISLHEPEGHRHAGRAGTVSAHAVRFPSVAAGTAAAVNVGPGHDHQRR